MDGRLVQLVRSDGKVAVFTRAAAMCMMKTDFSCWYNEAVTGFRTDEVVEALQRFPQSANHLNSKGHNLITAATEFQDSETLERVVNLMPAGSPVFSLIGRGRDALGLAIRKADDGMVRLRKTSVSSHVFPALRKKQSLAIRLTAILIRYPYEY